MASIGDQPVVGHHPRARASPARKLALTERCAPGRRLRAAKRSMGRSCVVPWTRTSATSACQAASWSLKSSRSREHAPGHEVALDVLHARLDLALGLRPVRLAQPRLEAPVPAKALEGRIPRRLLPLAGSQDHGAHAVVEQSRRGAPPKWVEGMLVRRQQRVHALMLVALGPSRGASSPASSRRRAPRPSASPAAREPDPSRPAPARPARSRSDIA